LNGWKNYFSQLLNVHRISDIRQIGIHTSGPLVSEPCPLELEITFSKLRKYKSPGSGQIQAGAETLRSETHKLINSIRSKVELPD
jgi:hypothetical protein